MINILVLLAIIIIMLSFKKSKKYLLEIFAEIKDYLVKLAQLGLKKIINYLSKIELDISKKTSISNKLLLEDLTANLDEKKNNQVNTYLDALSFAVQNQNVINIALTGGYGTGKSTIINQFCKNNRGNEYLHISLASFKDDKSDEKLIETSIVQQILYYEKKIKIKESSYKRIDFTKPFRKITSIFLFTLWFYTLIFLFFEKINDKLIVFTETRTNIELIKFIFIVGVFFIFYRSFDKIKNLKLSKLTPSSLEIVNEKTDKDLSVFNRNIDEIIYFFEKTNTNIVIVEDIDRFSDDLAIKLYSKIRELSILIKQSKDVIQPVKFIYSVKDELILEDKTKFFDIIIPVIPITDYNNSKNVFLSKLDVFFEKEEVENNEAENEAEERFKSYLDRNFISEISNYVHDMRMVINICNEFKLYNKILTIDKPNIDVNKLFAIIFYKNIFPDDFAKIQKRTSKLHHIFRKDFENDVDLKIIVSKIDEEIINKKYEKNNLEKLFDNHLINDIQELRSIYIFRLIEMIEKRNGVKIKGIEGLNIGNVLINDENFPKIKESEDIKFNYDYTEDKKSGISFKGLENAVNKELTYNEREKHISDFHNSRIGILEREIKSLEDEKQNIQNLSLFELYNKYETKIDKFLNSIYIDSKQEKESIIEGVNLNTGLFRYLLKNDFLNEDFIEYVSYFHLGSLSSNDHRLMMKINQNESTQFDEKIDDVENLIKSIIDIRFKNKAILIYDILQFLLQSTNYNKLNFFIKQIQNYDNESIHFISGFIEKVKNNNQLLSSFYYKITKWDQFWHFVKIKFYDNNLRRQILFDLVQLFSDPFNEVSVLIALNQEEVLAQSINTDKDFLKDIFEKIDINSLINTLNKLKVKFELITPDEKITDLLIKIYENNLYQINIDNLQLFSQIDPSYSFNEEKFFTSNFSFLRSKTETNLYNRISENLNEYIENVYLKIEQNINENSKEVLFLLEKDDEHIMLQNKQDIIKKGFHGKVESFGENQSREIVILLVEENKVLSSWENIMVYYNLEGPLTSILTKFLNVEENYSRLSINKLYEKFDPLFDNEESCFGFIYSLINDENLLEDSFQAIFDNSGSFILRSSKINLHSRISFLEEKGFFMFDREEFASLLNINKNVLVNLIEKNEEDFISQLNYYKFDIEFIGDLLNSQLSIESLNKIISVKKNEIVASESIYISQIISDFYLKNKLSNFTNELFEKLITSDIDEKHKIGLFNLAFSDENNFYDVSDLLKKMGDKFTKILDEEKVSFVISDQNTTFLKTLQEYTLIAGYRVNKAEDLLTTFY